MKVVAFLTYYDYDYAGVEDSGLIVPDDFDLQAEQSEWMAEGQEPITGRNQHGEWKSKKYKQPKILFRDWLRKKYETVQILECSSY